MTPAMTSHGHECNDRGHSLSVQIPEARSMPLGMTPGVMTPPEARPPVSVGFPGDAMDGAPPYARHHLGHAPTPFPPYRAYLAQAASALSAPQSQQLRGDNDNQEPAFVKHRRAPVACRRCRRLRSKCQHTSAKPPCTPCHDAGPEIAAECFFPARGEPDNDREFRRRRLKASEKQHLDGRAKHLTGRGRRGSNAVMISSIGSSDLPERPWALLPPLEEVIEGCRLFFTSYFQLGFLPKAMFIERLQRDDRSINPFLLLGLLAISARFVPKLVHRYGGSLQATEFMINNARKLVPKEMYQPDLERIQGFFLLSVAEWGHGDRTKSLMHMGIAVRMAGILRLHQEDAYNVPPGASADEIVDAEVARRTFWVIISQESLHSGAMTPASFSLSDITALLPCDEGDFAFGIIPKERAALSGTLAARSDESLVWLPSRSLFATLIQAHTLWGQCARASTRQGNDGPLTAPWQPSNRFAELSNALQEWERRMPERHRWSIWNLRGYRSEALDLAYLAVVMVLRLSNIVIRRVYLEDIINAKTCQHDDGVAPQGFWDRMSDDLFSNVLELHEQVDAFFSLRSQDEGFPAIIVFCIYTCGSLAYYLANWPQLCPSLHLKGSAILDRSLEALKGLSSAWPLAMRWQQALTRVLQRSPGPRTNNLNDQGPPPEQYSDNIPEAGTSQHDRPPFLISSAQQPKLGASASANLDLLANAAAHNDHYDQQPTPNTSLSSPTPQHGYLNVDFKDQSPSQQQHFQMAPEAFAADGFEAELTAFFQRGEAAVFWNGFSGWRCLNEPSKK